MSDVAQLSAQPTARLRERAGSAVTDENARFVSAATIAAIADRFAAFDLFERLAAVRALVSGRIVFTTSFGLEDQAIAHAIFTQDLAIDVATFDTGRLFPETHEVWTETERRYGARILAYAPDHASVQGLIAQQGADGFRDVGRGPGSAEARYIDWLTITDNAQSVVEDVTRIRSHPLVPASIPVYGYIYDVATGRLNEVPDATNAGQAS